MSASMAEVLAEHQEVAWDYHLGQAICAGCDKELGPFTADMDEQNKWLLAHVAEALAAAGYGLLADAWDAGHHAGVLNVTDMTDAPFRDNPYERKVP